MNKSKEQLVKDNFGNTPVRGGGQGCDNCRNTGYVPQRICSDGASDFKPCEDCSK